MLVPSCQTTATSPPCQTNHPDTFSVPAGLVERVTYDAYGQARHHYRSDIDGDGDVDRADATALSNSLNKSIGDAAYNVDADIDRSGTVDTADQSILNADNPTTALAKGLISDPSVDNQIGWDGYVFNAETQQYHVRNRCYSPDLGRWLERDRAVPSVLQRRRALHRRRGCR